MLSKVIAVGPLAAGVSTTVSHGLEKSPITAIPDRSTSIIVVGTPTTSQITFKNNGSVTATANFRIRVEHSIVSEGVDPILWQGSEGTTGEVFNVKNYGAAGDGVTDDTAAITGAITAAIANPVGGNTNVVKFPAGAYKVTTNIAVLNTSLVALVGEGYRSTSIVFRPTIPATDCFTFKDTGAGYSSHNAIVGMFIDANSVNARYALDVVHQSNFTAEGVYTSMGIDGLHFSFLQISRFDKCLFKNASSDGVLNDDGASGTTSTTFSDCDVSSNGASGFRLGNATCRIVNCTVQANGTYGIYGGEGTDYNPHVVLIGNHLEANVSGAIRLSDGAAPGAILAFLASLGNTFIGTGAVNHFAFDFGQVVGFSCGDYAPASGFTAIARVDRAGANTIRFGFLTNPIGNLTEAVTSPGTLVQEDSAVGDSIFGYVGSPIDKYFLWGASGTLTPKLADGGIWDSQPLTGNITVANSTGGTPIRGQRFQFSFIQDGTGGRTVTWGTQYKKSWSDAGNAANTRSTISFYWNGSNWVQDSYVPWFLPV